MTQGARLTPNSRRRGLGRMLLRGVCGAFVASVVWTAVSQQAQAAPAGAARAPILSQGVVGLQQGATGSDVKAVQQALLDAGVAVVGGADGHFGPATRSAVMVFQSRSGLPLTGAVDQPTAVALGLASPTPTTTPGTSAFAGLEVGASGPAVEELQRALMAAGVYVAGGADGQFGQATKAAVTNYQRWNGLTVSGVVDQATADRLGLSGSAGAPAPQPEPTPPEPEPTPPEPTPDPPNATNPYVGLAIGARGQLVKDLQQALIDAGITVRGGADGVFGSATRTALQTYQRDNGLGVSGAVYPATAAHLGLGVTAPVPDPPPPAPDPAPPEPDPAPQPDSPSNPYVGLAAGDRGQLVKDLQQALMDTGLVVRGGADGIFGNATRRALIAFQSVNGIAQTGVVTEQGAGILGLGTTPAPPPSGFGPTAPGFPVKGESSERVRLLQQRLIDWGVVVRGGADGSFGNATQAAIEDFQRRHGLTVTGTVTEQTASKLGLAPRDPEPSPPPPGAVVMERFPVQGQCYFGDTWHAPRGGNRVHEGVDIIAGEGNLLYAVVDGTITKQYWDYPGALAGNGLRLAEDDGTYFTYLHMSSFAPGLEVGTKVKAGDVIGFVGNTGSSATAHLHFEIHPRGGAAVNPYPYVKAIDDCGNTTPQYQSSFAPPAPPTDAAPSEAPPGDTEPSVDAP